MSSLSIIVISHAWVELFNIKIFYLRMHLLKYFEHVVVEDWHGPILGGSCAGYSEISSFERLM